MDRKASKQTLQDEKHFKLRKLSAEWMEADRKDETQQQIKQKKINW